MTHEEAALLLFREAALLDNGAWAEWLDLYTENAIFWVPAWKDEVTITSDPDAELSLIYYNGRQGLADRVKRATSGLSVASSPRARCVHAISNVMVHDNGAEAVEVGSVFTVHRYDVRAEQAHCFFGYYRHHFVVHRGKWLISSKKAVLLNDCIPTVLDFFSI